MQVPVIEDPNPDSVDLTKYLLLIWHWLWLIILVVAIAGVGAYYISRLIPPVYEAKTTVLVDMAPSNKSIDYSSLQLSSQLTQTYSQMMTKSPVLDEVAKRIGLVEVDAKAINAKPVTNTQLINILAESTNPQLAADIANMLVTVFAEQIQTLQTTRFADSEESLQTQMADVEVKIKSANDQLSITTDPTEKDRLETMIANYSQTYAGLLQSFEQVRLAEAQTRSSIVQIEPAAVPLEPVRPKIVLNIALAALISGVLMGGIIIGSEVLTDAVKTPEEIANKLGLPVLGVISHHSKREGGPITEAQPLSPVTEAFRTLRTNVKYAGAGLQKPLRTIVVTSAQAGEGKTEILVNLGIVLAQNKMRVLLMDADLRRPSLHRRLGLDNLIGLSQIFVHPELGMSYSLQPTRIHGLTVITSGDTPPNPSELLGSQIMGNLMEEVRNNFDIVLIDTPPALAVTDAAVLLQFVDGVLLVIKPGVTNMAPLRRLIHQFHLMNANLLGGVLNDINIRNSTYGYYYRQYKYYNDYSRKNEKKQVKKKSSNHNQHTFKDKAMKSMVRQAIRMLTLLTNKL
jgi:capsular exopolysaccharide synthesis family protein